MKPEVAKIIKAVDELKDKQALSDSLDVLIKEITESTDINGDIELMITRTKKVFLLDSNILINRLTNKKQNADSDVDVIVSNITINGK